MAIDAHANEREVPLWLANNGASTLRNYGGGRISPEHLARLAAVPFCRDDGLRFFLHARVDLDVPLAEQEPEGRLWMREPLLAHWHGVRLRRFISPGPTPA